MTATEILRKQVRKYINTADENTLRRVNAILEIDQNSNEWWTDKQFLKELDSMNEAIEWINHNFWGVLPIIYNLVCSYEYRKGGITVHISE